MRIKIFLIILFVLFFGNLASADPMISASAHIDKKSVLIGEKIKFNIDIKADKSLEIDFPEIYETLGDLSIVDSGIKENLFLGKKYIKKWYLLDSFKPGNYTIPELEIKYKNPGGSDWKAYKISSQSVEVKSVLDEFKDSKDIRDIKGPVSLKGKLNKLVLIIVLVTALLIALIFIYIKRKKIFKAIIKVKLPHEIAYERLEALRKKDYIAKGFVKEFFVEISDIIRQYIEARFSLRAPDMTTEEFMAKAKSLDSLTAGHKELLQQFLNCCDMVKFAKYIPGEPESVATFNSAKGFIDETKIVSVEGKQK